MPSKSKAQQRFMGMVHATKKGEMKNPPASVKKAAKGMSKKSAHKYASTKHQGKPEKVKKETKVSQLIRKMVREIMAEIDEGGKGSGRPRAATPATDKDNKRPTKNPFSKESPAHKTWEKKKSVKEDDVVDKEREKQRADKEKMRDRQFRDMERARERQKRLDKMKKEGKAHHYGDKEKSKARYGEAYPELDKKMKAADDPMAHAYPTKEQAMKDAKKMGLSGVHMHKDKDGKTIYMPGGSHEEFTKRHKEIMEEKKKGKIKSSLWENIRKKRERIKSGSGEKRRKKGDKGAPTSDQIKKAQK